MAIDHGKVRRAFRKRLLAMAGLPDEQFIAWQNVPFTPPQPSSDPAVAPQPWLRETYLKGDDVLVATNTLECVGIYQIDVFGAAGNGPESPEELARLIVQQFPAASAVVDASTTPQTQAAVYRSTALRGYQDQKVWYVVPVQITFRTYAQNP